MIICHLGPPLRHSRQAPGGWIRQAMQFEVHTFVVKSGSECTDFEARGLLDMTGFAPLLTYKYECFKAIELGRFMKRIENSKRIN